MILNMISTGAMVQIGKTLGNRMVDLQPSNEKLRIRSRRILRELAGVDDALAGRDPGAVRRPLETGLGGRAGGRRSRHGPVAAGYSRRPGPCGGQGWWRERPAMTAIDLRDFGAAARR